jgi:hypothetical protein
MNERARNTRVLKLFRDEPYGQYLTLAHEQDTL